MAAHGALTSGVRRVVPLPKSIYEANFQIWESVKEFHDLLHQPTSWFELSMLPARPEAKVWPQGEARDR